MRIHIKTFGCKLNQAEAERLESALVSVGHELCEPPCDIAIVCGCTVTSRADFKVRQYLRRLSRDSGIKRLILSGCSAVNLEEMAIEKLGVEKTFPTNEPAPILEYLRDNGNFPIDKKWILSGRTRVFVKIQDGCDKFCSYCIVPFVRGREISIAPQDIINQINALVNAGTKEVVFTGVHIGRYFSENISLTGLCEKALKETNIARIRLSSLEPDEIDHDLIFLLENERRMASHIHLSIQSGCDRTLKRMNRGAISGKIADIVVDLAEKVGDISIGADIIVGFPGETDEDFNETYNFIERLPITYLHIFRYSRRRGTVAYDLPNQIPEYIKRERMEALKLLDINKRNKFGNKQIGIIQDVLIEKITGNKAIGTTSNYLKAEMLPDGISRNNIIKAKAIDYNNRILYCETKHII